MRLLLAALAVLACACHDECDWKTFAPRCEENVLVYCPMPGVDQLVPVRIGHRDCGDKVCVAEANVCALSSSPEPLCADGGVSACRDATTLLYCANGFATDSAPCRSCDAGACEGGPSTQCTRDSDCAATLRCADAGFGSFCRK